jgi:hypothetical protein
MIEKSVISEMSVSDSITIAVVSVIDSVVKCVTKVDANSVVESVTEVDMNSTEFVVWVCMIF